MSDRALIQNMLMRNALYNDGVGSTNGAGLYDRRAGAGYIGGAKYNRKRGGARLGGAMLGGCHMCQSGECMNCGSGYIGGFAGEQAERKRIKALYPGKGKSIMSERRAAFTNFLKLHPDDALLYADEKQNRAKGRSNYLLALENLRESNQELPLAQLRRLYKLEHPKPKRARKEKAPRKPRAPGKPRQLKGCNPNMPAGLYAYCEYVKGYKEQYPGSSAADARAAWHAGVQLA